MKKLLICLVTIFGLWSSVFAQNPTIVYVTNNIVLFPPTQHAGKVILGFDGVSSFNAAGATNLNASELRSGTIAVGVMPAGIAYLANNQIFTATNNFSGPLIIGTNAVAMADNRGITLVGGSENMLTFRRTSDGTQLGNLGLGTLKLSVKSTGAGVDLDLNAYDEILFSTANGNQRAVFNNAGDLVLSNNFSIPSSHGTISIGSYDTNSAKLLIQGANGVLTNYPLVKIVGSSGRNENALTVMAVGTTSNFYIDKTGSTYLDREPTNDYQVATKLYTDTADAKSLTNVVGDGNMTVTIANRTATLAITNLATLQITGEGYVEAVNAALGLRTLQVGTGINFYPHGGSSSNVLAACFLSNGNFVVYSNFVARGLTYPTADGNNGEFIKTDGAGNLSFGPASGTGTSSNFYTTSWGTGKAYTLGDSNYVTFVQDIVPTGKTQHINQVRIICENWGTATNTVVQIYDATATTTLLSTNLNWFGNIEIPTGNKWYARIINNTTTNETVSASIHGEVR